MSNIIEHRIAGRGLGPGFPVLIIAEIGQAHDGSLGAAHAYVDAVAKTGADAIKFQTHIADAESTPQEKFRVRVFPQDATRYDYWKRTAFTFEQWSGLADHARERGLIFLSTPFSIQAVDLLERLEMPAWKIGSGEIGNIPMLERIAKTGKPVLLSSGMSPWAELDEAVACVRRVKAPLAVFQCTTSYPCPPEKVGLNILGELRQRYGCPVGLSDHSGTIYSGLAATSLGANLLEVHVVFSNESFGPDVSSSLVMADLARLVEGVRFIEKALANPVQKDMEAAAREDLRKIFGKSLVAARHLPVGSRLEIADIDFKKPGTGIPASRVKEIIGKVTKRSFAANELLEEQDIE